MKPFVAEDAPAFAGSVLQSGWLGEGPRVVEFEAGVAAVVGSDHVCALNSGTSALELACDLAGLRAGDEIISTPMTCAATNIPVVRRGVRIKWADIDPSTGCIDVSSIAAGLDRKTKAIMVMDWGGTPCDLDRIQRLADEAGVPVIEDAAHAFGSEYKGRPVGQTSNFVCFSFQAVKTITTGDGGALVCLRAEDHEKARLARWFGIDRAKRTSSRPWDFPLDVAGYKFHMNDIAASIGLANLPYLTRLLQVTAANTARYDERLRTVPQVRLTTVPAYGKSSHWLYTALCERRDDLMTFLLANGIGCGIAHSRNDQYSIFQDCFAGGELRGVDDFAANQLNLPVGYWVGTEDIDRICGCIEHFYRR